jgi:AcrR family transcriptional regulator
MSENPTAPEAQQRSVDEAPDRSLPASRHYRRAQRDRGAETRAQLIEAALDIFGTRGFEGASTREIAKQAGANLAAIVYHFGSKEALYLAVAEHVVTRINERMAPMFDEAVAMPDDPAAARAMLLEMAAMHVEVLLDNHDAERWSRFLVRENMQPTAAFEVAFKVFGQSLSTLNRVMSTALSHTVDEEEIAIRCFAFIGQVMVFRVLNAMVLRHLNWESIGPRERAVIRRVMQKHIDAILDAGSPA